MPVLHKVARSGFIQILHHCSVSWKIVPLYIFSSNLKYFGQKRPTEVKFSDFWLIGWKLTQFLMSYLKPEVSFSLNFASSSTSWEITLLHFFNWDFIWFGRKKPIKVQNFRLSTAHVKFHQMCTLTGSFCRKYIQFQIKKYKGMRNFTNFDGSTRKFQKFAL